jgi:amino acid permease
MANIKNFFKGAALVAASTFGAGIFALPYVFKEAGWIIGIFYLAVFSCFIVAAHILYWKVLVRFGEKKRILGLARDYLGNIGYFFGVLGVATGLILTLAAYLILGSIFLAAVLPVFGSATFFVFWLAVSFPLLFGDKRASAIEFFGITATSLIIAFIFFSALPSSGFFSATPANLKNIFLPFGAILFALAGWTSIERVYDWFRGTNVSPAKISVSIGGGTALIALLYVMFVFGIFGSASVITPDTISGVSGWPVWKSLLLGILGLVAIWTSHLPISLEAKNVIEHDLHWSPAASRAVVFFLPVILVILGLNSFLRIISVVGGVFIGLQYLLIILVGKKILRPSGVYNLLLNFTCVIFAAAAVYEIYYFIVG